MAAANWLDKQNPSNRQKIIFVFSDFDDDASFLNLRKTISTVQQLHIPVIFVAPSEIEHKKQGKNIKQLVQATSGHAYFVPQKGNFDFSLLKHDLAR